MKTFLKTILASVLLVPIFAHAQFEGTVDMIDRIGYIISILIPIVAALALLYFFWGLAKFILNAANDEEREKGKNVMKWGIVALFVMVSIWGIVAFIQDELLPGYSGGYGDNVFSGMPDEEICTPGQRTC